MDNDEDLTLELIGTLGGTKKDLELLADIEDEEELVSHQEDLNVDPVNRNELRDFIESLEIGKYRPKLKAEDEEKKKVKLLSMPVKDDEKQKTQEVVTSKKKKKNKFKVQHEEVSSTTLDKPTLDLSFIDLYQPRKHLLIKPGGQWQDHVFQNEPKVWEPSSDDDVKKLKNQAARLLKDDVILYRKQQDQKKSSDVTWLRTVLSSGTSTDKLAALTLVIQESPIHNLASLESLISMVSKKGQRMALQTLDRLRELFLSDILPDDRKLTTFEQHAHNKLEEMSSGNKESRDKRLVMWYFEHQLKHMYTIFINALQNATQDAIQATKKKAVDAIFELLSNKPEQEKTLLTLLVNKLGDPDHKVAARCSHLLTKLVEKHPNMKQVVVLEVERLMYRPNMKPKAQYYAVCFLNQLILTDQEKQLASRLISIYFSFFKAFVKKQDLETKMLSALLSGVNRAYPYAKVEQQKMEEQTQMMYKVLHSVSFNTSIQALLLLQQVTDASDNMSDRYYMALYRKMVDPQLRTSSRQAMFLNLLFKSLKTDISEKRVKAFVKRLLQVCCQHSPPFICGALLLLAELIKARRGLLNLQKAGVDLGEDEDDEEEHFRDVPDEDDTAAAGGDDDDDGQESPSAPAASQPASWIHRTNYQGPGKGHSGDYDMQQRNPLYCRADRECMWELTKLQHHYHPTVVLFANNIIKEERVTYPGDPLQDFTLIRFLDRFVYRNPKKKESLPATESGKLLLSNRKRYKVSGIKRIPVTSEEYLMRGEESIPVDEKFIYKYLVQQAPKKKQNEEEEVDSDASDVSDTEFDDYLESHERGLMAEGELDFAGELGRLKGMRKRRKKKPKQDEDGDEVDLSDEEVEFSDDEEMQDMVDDEEDDISDPLDEENIAFSDDDDFGGADFDQLKGKQKKRKLQEEDGISPSGKYGKKGKGDDGDNLFAAAEEFSHLIDKNMGAKFDMIGSEAMANKDNAHMKQLLWEEKRAKQFEGKDWRSKGRGKFKGKGNKLMGNKKFTGNKKGGKGKISFKGKKGKM